MRNIKKTYDPNPNKMKERCQQIVKTIDLAIKLIMGFLAIGTFYSEYVRIKQMQPDIMNYMYLSLFIISAFYIFIWILVVQIELDMLFKWLDPKDYDPPSTIKEVLLILLFSVVLVILLFMSRNPLWYGLAFLGYNILNILLGGIYTFNHIGEAIDKSKERIEIEMSTPPVDPSLNLYYEAIQVIDYYYRQRPVKERLMSILIISVIGLVLACVWNSTGDKIWGLASYLVYVCTIIASEAVIMYWRHLRDTKLRRLAAKISELKREFEND